MPGAADAHNMPDVPPKKTTINIDAELEEQFPADKEPPVKTVPVELFGEEISTPSACSSWATSVRTPPPSPR
jgi:hypothetical protein